MGTPAVVTPEAVPLDLQPAGLGSRFVALLIDWAVQFLLAFAVLLLGIGLSAGDLGGLGIALFFLLAFGVLLGYPVALETLWRGRTVGKAAMGLRVVTTEGGPVRFRHAAIRAALGLVDFILTSGAAAVISVLATRNNQRLGDLVAGTLVLRERTGLPPPEAAEFAVPGGLEWYASSLDVSRMTADDYRALRAFLLRAPTLDYRVRYQLAVGLADPLSERVRPLPPAGIHPAWYLICVAAVYQQRHASRTPSPTSAFPAAPPPVTQPPLVQPPLVQPPLVQPGPGAIEEPSSWAAPGPHRPQSAGESPVDGAPPERPPPGEDPSGGFSPLG